MSDPYKPTDAGQASQAADALKALPSLEDTRTQVESALEKLGQQITAIAPSVTWEWRRTDSKGGCNPPYEQSDGQLLLLRNYVSDTPIPEQNWKQAADLAQLVASSLGATELIVFKGQPNDHDLLFSSETGTTLRFGSQAAALITGSTGCRLPSKYR
ncbi:LppA family lipoprotein [Mycolicibacterium setense]|uniref:LppA family lipoprotein n=1 Tax=Mycolicibacterium setense TaxID=431269 RepID=UPI0012FF3EE9|nr:LppA family lipoprotein [Mycolicibacterium setense]MCV7110068.1 LppA family lipoprotein [Mycolicibacterium setense]